MARQAGKRAGMAHPQSEPAGTLVAGIVSLGAPARREPQADAHLRRTRLRRQAREPGVFDWSYLDEQQTGRGPDGKDYRLLPFGPGGVAGRIFMPGPPNLD